MRRRVQADTSGMWNEILSVLITAVTSVVVLFALTKLMGNKQISQMSMFDYIVGITIGSIAAELATELETPLLPVIAMTVYALLAFLISVLTSRFPSLRKLMTGRPLLLLDGGVIYRANMRKARFDVNDFLTLCRVNGYFDVSDIQTAILEENGTVSFLPKEGARPVEPRDIGAYPEQSGVCANVILDGVPLLETLAAYGHDEAWLRREMLLLGFEAYQDVYLATVDVNGKLAAYPMTNEKRAFSPFD